MLCFIFGAFRTVRTIAQFGSALDWGSRGRGFKSRWSDRTKPVVPPLTRHWNDGLFRIQGRSGAMYYGPPPPRPHGGESPGQTKQAPSGSVMPEGACRGRRTGHGAGKLEKTALAALRGAGSGPSGPWPCGRVDAPCPLMRPGAVPATPRRPAADRCGRVRAEAPGGHCRSGRRSRYWSTVAPHTPSRLMSARMSRRAAWAVAGWASKPRGTGPAHQVSRRAAESNAWTWYGMIGMSMRVSTA